MAENSEIDPREFVAMRRLLSSETAEVDQDVVQGLVAKRFVRRSADGWTVTVPGHAAYLHELRKMFERPPSGD